MAQGEGHEYNLSADELKRWEADSSCLASLARRNDKALIHILRRSLILAAELRSAGQPPPAIPARALAIQIKKPHSEERGF
jgi:hypothetical protein